MRKSLLSAAMLFALGTPALSADLAARAPASVVTPPPVFSWTGFYVGAHGGGGWSEWSGMDPTAPADGWSSVNASGGVAGGQVGGNYQISNFVIGLEGTYAWSGITLNDNSPFAGGAGFTLTLKNDYLATAAGRIGVAFDRVLLYGKGGAAFTRDKYTGNNGLAGALAGATSGSFDRTGWLAGAGVEWMFLPHWSVKGEYNYMRFGSLTEQPSTTGNLAASPAIVRLDIQTATVGVNYHF